MSGLYQKSGSLSTKDLLIKVNTPEGVLALRGPSLITRLDPTDPQIVMMIEVSKCTSSSPIVIKVLDSTVWTPSIHSTEHAFPNQRTVLLSYIGAFNTVFERMGHVRFLDHRWIIPKNHGQVNKEIITNLLG
jgi:hypothetical protein